MTDIKMYEALVISMVLAALVFRINYTSNVKNSRARYTEKGIYNYMMLSADLITAIIFSFIGCYLAWDAISTIPNLVEYQPFIFPASILNGVIFQQALPILIELVMNKINSFRPNQNNWKES